MTRLNMLQDRLLAQCGCRTSLVQESICCDTADQKDESQCGAAETDGHSDTYVHEKVRHLAADQMLSETGGKGGMSIRVSVCERDYTLWPKVCSKRC